MCKIWVYTHLLFLLLRFALFYAHSLCIVPEDNIFIHRGKRNNNNINKAEILCGHFAAIKLCKPLNRAWVWLYVFVCVCAVIWAWFNYWNKMRINWFSSFIYFKCYAIFQQTIQFQLNWIELNGSNHTVTSYTALLISISLSLSMPVFPLQNVPLKIYRKFSSCGKSN